MEGRRQGCAMHQYYSERVSVPVPPHRTTRSIPASQAGRQAGMRMGFGVTGRLIYEDQIEKTERSERNIYFIYPSMIARTLRPIHLYFLFRAHSFFPHIQQLRPKIVGIAIRAVKDHDLDLTKRSQLI